MQNNRISVITATYNSDSVIDALIQSIKEQSDKDFDWIVVDGGSTDKTIAMLEASGIVNLVIDSQNDFGIYDALNRGVRLCKSEYYLVCGADDYFYPDAIANFKKALDFNGSDFISCQVDVGGLVSFPGNGRFSWLKGLRAHISAHSVGLLIRTELHQKYGFYSKKFPIAADQLFVLSALKAGASLCKANFTSGRFTCNGVSSIDCEGLTTEFYRVQLLLGHNKMLQWLLLIFRLMRCARKNER